MSNIFFSIITPTYKRPDKLQRAVQSFLDQNYTESELIIINDSPEYDYSFIEKKLQNQKQIKYFKNKENSGNNYCKNFAFTKLDLKTDYIIFLDDDDYLNQNALNELNNILQKEKISWLITNRALFKENKITPITQIKKIKKSYNYFLDYVIFKNINGDATHIIKKEIATKYNFSNKVKNGEEIFYFMQLPSKFIYKNLNTTLSDGYLEDGLTEVLKNKYKSNTYLMLTETKNLKQVLYLILRIIKILILYIKTKFS